MTPPLCSHCRLPLPSRIYRDQQDGESLAFCCVGCRMVFRIVGSTGDAGQANWFLAKLGMAALLAGNVMLFQSLLYFGTLQSVDAAAWRTASWIMLAMSTVVYLLLGVPMLRSALRAAREGRLVLETLIGFGALAAIAASAIATWRGSDQTYYDSGTMVLVLIVLGQYLDARARQRAGDVLSPLLNRTQRLARVERDGQERSVPPMEVLRGELVHVRAGDEIPVDGLVIKGSADVHESALTGEALPRLVRLNDQVYAGSVAVDGALTIEASGESETLARRIERWTVEARATRSPLEIAADRFVTRFIPAVVLVAVASAIGWGLLAGSWERGALAALAVLVVACPCAMGIATPMASTIALATMAARGVLVRGGAVLEALAGARHVAFDKTGTLTQGRPTVVGVHLAQETPLTEEELWALAAAVAVHVDHPLSRAIADRAREQGITIPPADIRAIPGAGAGGLVGGRTVLLGNESLLARHGVLASPRHTADVADGVTFTHVARDTSFIGSIALRDRPRAEASEAVKRLNAMGISSALLSGDSPVVVSAIGREIGLDAAQACMSPQQKQEQIQAMKSRGGLVVMVGDGINDAPALAAADVGIAFGSAADLARHTADVVILRDDLNEVPHLLARARRTMRIMKQNLAWALAYNAFGIMLAAFGLLRPVAAAAAMVASSLFVVGNSLRLRRDRFDVLTATSTAGPPRSSHHRAP